MKPKVAFFDFASCEGCQLALLNCEDILLSLLEQIDLVEFREALSETGVRYDIAFVEGSIHREIDAERLRAVRQQSTYLVALGACAHNGCVQKRADFLSPVENLQAVYGAEAVDKVQVDPKYWPLWAHHRVRRVDEVVAVDFYLRGCPMVPSEFIQLVQALLKGQQPDFPANPVCVECKKAENECVFDQGEVCLGPITYGGCQAVCITNGHLCDGCRGLLPGADLQAFQEVMRNKGIAERDLQSRWQIHLAQPLSETGK